MNSLWLYLHFPHLQLNTLQQQSAEPEQAAAPLVILNSKSNTIVQLNSAAEALGISHNMGLGSAAALSQSLLVVPYQADTERAKLDELAEHLYLATSDICLQPPDGLLLRIHNMLNLYGGLSAYWQAIQLMLSEHPVDYQFATGHSPFAARMLARCGVNRVSQDPGWHQQQIAKCDLKAAELPGKQLQQLNRVGIQSVGDLLHLSLKDIAKRFDIDLVTYIGRLTGDFQHPVNFFQPTDHFHRYLELLFDIENSETLIHPLKHVLRALEQFLKIRDQLTQTLLITLHQRDTDDYQLEVGSAQGEYQAEQWLSLLALQLPDITLNAPVYALTVTTGNIHERTVEATDLFAGKQGALSHLQLISVLQAKLGKQAVCSPCLIDDHRPELANGQQAALHPYMQLPQVKASRPSFLLHTPQALREKVAIVHGPERLNTGWWDKHPVLRDYFIARSQQGQWYWVFRTPENHWFLHGIFS